MTLLGSNQTLRRRLYSAQSSGIRHIGRPHANLAELYGVPTKALNQAVKRNAGRFPPDFMFQLDAPEKAEVVTNCALASRPLK